MRRRDIVELIGIGAATAIVGVWRAELPSALPVGEIALVASALLLGQGLIRDLYIKYSLRKAGGASCSLDPAKKATCMCMESTLGIFGILAGVVALLGGGIRHLLLFPDWFWPAMVLAVGIVGFLLKSLVIDWKARRIRIETNHENVRF